MMLGDVILGQIMDDDVRRHGRPREAVFYGLAAVLARLSGWLSAESFVLLTRLFGDVSGERPGPNPDGTFRFFYDCVAGGDVPVDGKPGRMAVAYSKRGSTGEHDTHRAHERCH